MFNDTFQHVEYSGPDAFSVWDNQGAEFLIEVSYQYRITPEGLPDLFQRYSFQYPQQVEMAARSILKNKFPDYNIDDYRLRRRATLKDLSVELSDNIKNYNVDVGVDSPACGAPVFKSVFKSVFDVEHIIPQISRCVAV